MLTDHEVAEIERRFREGEKGPVALTWVEKLLEDRRERVNRQEYFRQRIRKAFEYLDKLAQEQTQPAHSRPCPKCGLTYEVARPDPASRGKIYVHLGGKECLLRPD